MPTTQALVMRLRPLAQRDTGRLAACGEPPFISAFVSRRRETIAAFATPVTGLMVVVEGRKQVQWGAETRRYGAGDAFLLPAGSCVDVVNDPDEASGFYRALFRRFSRDLVIVAARLWPDDVGRSPDEGAVAL